MNPFGMRIVIGFAVLSVGVSPPAFALEDPTRPELERSIETRRAADKPPRLSSILMGGTRRLAVLDGALVGEGDQVAGYRVAAIEADAVIVSGPQGEKRLSLPEVRKRIRMEKRFVQQTRDSETDARSETVVVAQRER